jgi:hypothetical protein
MECDHIHSLIERKIKNQPMYVPEDYVRATEAARKHPQQLEAHLLSFDFYTDCDNNMFYKSIRPGRKVGDPQV